MNLPANQQGQSDLVDRVSWSGEAQTRVRKYHRLISLSKRCSIFFGKHFPNAFPLLFVLGHPKSGTTWMCQLLADYLRIPFPQHSILPLGCSAVLHSFQAPSKKYRHGVYMIRDGRDSAVSAYFHIRGRLLAGSKTRYNLKMFRGIDVDAEPRQNMVTFLDRLYRYPTGGLAKLPNWSAHVSAYFDHAGENLQLCRYEDLLADGEQAFTDVIQNLTGETADPHRIAATIEKYSFTAQTGRKSGEENRSSYLRKGQSGDWRNHFTRASAELFDRQCGDTLIRAGYATDRDWITEVE